VQGGAVRPVAGEGGSHESRLVLLLQLAVNGWCFGLGTVLDRVRQPILTTYTKTLTLTKFFHCGQCRDDRANSSRWRAVRNHLTNSAPWAASGRLADSDCVHRPEKRSANRADPDATARSGH
jgi:hypothetical protein